MTQEEDDLAETTGGGFQREKPSKVKKFIKTVEKGTGRIGSTVSKGTKSLVKKYKQYQSPEAQQARLDMQEKRLQQQARITQQKGRIRKLQAQRGGGLLGGGGASLFGSGSSGGRRSGLLGGFQGIDMANVLNGEPTRKRKGKGKPFDPFSQF